jgi:hypothetical protein
MVKTVQRDTTSEVTMSNPFPASGPVYDELKAYVQLRADKHATLLQPAQIKKGMKDSFGKPPSLYTEYDPNNFKDALCQIKNEVGYQGGRDPPTKNEI